MVRIHCTDSGKCIHFGSLINQLFTSWLERLFHQNAETGDGRMCQTQKTDCSGRSLTICKEIIDDFLANGEAATGAIRLLRLAHATIAGLGVLVEKSFQPGREKLVDQGTEVYALARVGAMDTDHVEFLPADDE